MTFDWIVVVALVAAMFADGVRRVRAPVVLIIVGVVVGVAGGIDVPHEMTKYAVPIMGAMLVFLAGSEVDVPVLARKWRTGILVGAGTVLAAGGAAWAISTFAGDWSSDAAWLSAIAFGAPSVSLVYVLLVRTHLTGTDRAALLMVPTLFAAVAVMSLLGVLFVEFERPLLVFAAASALVLVALPAAVRLVARALPGVAKEISRELIILAALGTLALLAREANMDAAIVALFVGLRMRRCDLDGRDCKRVRKFSLPAVTAIFFVVGGMTIPLLNVLEHLPLVLALAAAKLLAFDLAMRGVGGAVKWEGRATDGLAMASGTTLLVLAANFGVAANIVNTDQYGVMVVSAVLAAVVGSTVAEIRINRAARRSAAQPVPVAVPEAAVAQPAQAAAPSGLVSTN